MTTAGVINFMRELKEKLEIRHIRYEEIRINAFTQKALLMGIVVYTVMGQ